MRGWTLVVLSLAACDAQVPSGASGDPAPLPETNALFITPIKGTWNWEEVAGPTGSGVKATLRNGSPRHVTSTLGDRFNSATEQSDLFVALGGHGSLEWLDAGGIWRDAPLAHLVEGVKAVVLRSGGNYTLTALLREPRRTGTYRIRVDFFDSPDGAVRQSDYSASFIIR